MKYTLFLIMLALRLTATAQDISGKWTGNHGPILDPNSNERIEMTIVQKGEQLSGISKCINVRSHEYSISRLVGTLSGETANIFEEQLIDFHISDTWCLEQHTGDLTIDSVNKIMIIRGTTRTHKHYDPSRGAYTGESCSPGFFVITKPFTFTEIKTEPDAGKQTEPIQQTPVVEQSLERKRNVLDSFNVVSDSLTMSFYDDSNIDGDTVTVYYNNKMMLNRQLLSGTPLIITVPVTPGIDNELVMFANNVGSIPPNTAVLVFYDNGNRRERRIDSDTKKSGTILIRKSL